MHTLLGKRCVMWSVFKNNWMILWFIKCFFLSKQVMAFPLSTQKVKSQTVRRSKASLGRGSFTVFFVLFLISFYSKRNRTKNVGGEKWITTCRKLKRLNDGDKTIGGSCLFFSLKENRKIVTPKVYWIWLHVHIPAETMGSVLLWEWKKRAVFIYPVYL